MRASLPALAVVGALMGAAAAAPARAQSETPAAAAPSPAVGNASAASAGASSSADGSAPAGNAGTPSPANAPAADDVKKAISQIRNSWRSYGPCERTTQCSTYFESFGVALSFDDGTMAPFSHEQRLKRSGHDCIQNAREALQQGDRALAVQWVMAAHLDDPLTRNWLGDHPDAVLEGLRHFRG